METILFTIIWDLRSTIRDRLRSSAIACDHMETSKEQITAATANKTSPYKRFNKQNNGYARAPLIFAHFVTVLCKTTT